MSRVILVADAEYGGLIAVEAYHDHTLDEVRALVGDKVKDVVPVWTVPQLRREIQRRERAAIRARTKAARSAR